MGYSARGVCVALHAVGPSGIHPRAGTQYYRQHNINANPSQSRSDSENASATMVIDSEATAEYALAAPLQTKYRTLWPAPSPGL